MQAIFTIVAKNYMASAITLGKSVKKFCEDTDFFIVLADEWDADGQEEKAEGRIVLAKELEIPHYVQMSFMYDVVEFATAVKPFAILYFLEKLSYDKVVYLDPDTWVMGSIDLIWKCLEKENFVLTPHVVELDVEHFNNKESHILARGVFNLGFLGIRRSTETLKFLTWWAKRLETECIRSSDLFVDQKWIDYLPVFFDNYEVIRDKEYNIADWNLHERKLDFINDRFCVLDGNRGYTPICFFHFSGIKQQNPQEYLNIIRYQGSPKEKEVLIDLITQYEQQLVDSDYEYWSCCRYQYNYLENGQAILMLQRRLFRMFYLKDMYVNDDPFKATSQFFQFLKRNRLLTNKTVVKKDDSSNKKEMSNGEKGARKLIKVFYRIFVRLFGARKFEQFLNKLNKASALEQQINVWK